MRFLTSLWQWRPKRRAGYEWRRERGGWGTIDIQDGDGGGDMLTEKRRIRNSLSPLQVDGPPASPALFSSRTPFTAQRGLRGDVRPAPFTFTRAQHSIPLSYERNCASIWASAPPARILDFSARLWVGEDAIEKRIHVDTPSREVVASPLSSFIAA